MPTFLITGANRGIGLELARQASTRGDHVIATARDPSKATALNELTADTGRHIEVAPLEVTDSASISALARALAGRPIDVLVNNAGIMGPKRQSSLDMDFEGFERTLAVNTIAPLRITQALLPNIRAAKGRIVAISSRMAIFADRASSQIAHRTSKI